MEFLIADTFTDALAKLPSQEQKAAKTTAFDLQLNPSSPGLQFHRIDKSKDPNFWSIRVNRDIRIIVHKTAASFLLCYVDHHDKAYDWAVRRRIEAHPRTGAVQIVEVRERVEEIAPPAPADVKAPVEEGPAAGSPLFEALSTTELLSIGVPQDWISDIRLASEDRFFDLVSHIPREAAEALLEYAATGHLATVARATALPTLSRHEEVSKALSFEYIERPRDPFAHPDSLRRFRAIENTEELRRALEFPWEKWAVFLHPSQRDIIERNFAGPARVAGSAGTGKTVVALHRTARLVQSNTDARVLLTTFSRPLAKMLEQKLNVLIGENSSVVPRVVVTPFRGLDDRANGWLPVKPPGEAAHLRKGLARALLPIAGLARPIPAQHQHASACVGPNGATSEAVNRASAIRKSPFWCRLPRRDVRRFSWHHYIVPSSGACFLLDDRPGRATGRCQPR
jgi:UvrD/REP helicase N-terminal domain